MSEKVYVLNVYNTMTGQYELIQVTKEVFQTYRRTKWNIEDTAESRQIAKNSSSPMPTKRRCTPR